MARWDRLVFQEAVVPKNIWYFVMSRCSPLFLKKIAYALLQKNFRIIVIFLGV